MSSIIKDFKKFLNWAKNTSIKSSDELATQKLRNLRSCCQAGSLAFSLLVLGIIMPVITVSKARKGRNDDIKNSQNNQVQITTETTGKAA